MPSTTDIQILLDKESLHDLIMTYCRATDRRDVDLLASVYHPGAIEDRGEIFTGTAVEFIEWSAGNITDFEITVHRVFNTLFVIEGDKAEGEIYVEAYHRTKGEEPMEIIAGGRFLDCYEKRDGKWGLVHRKSTTDRCTMHPANKEAYTQFVAGSIAGKCDSSDASYEALKLLPRLSAS